MAGELSVSFLLTDENGGPVIGAEPQGFLCSVFRDNGPTTDTVAVSELENGVYKAVGDASSLDKYHVIVTGPGAYLVNGQPAAAFDIYVDAVRDIDNILQHGVNNATHAVTIGVETPLADAVAGVTLRLTNTAGDHVHTQGVTDAGGQTTFNLEEGTVRVYPYKPGYSFEGAYVERTVSGPGTLTPIVATPLSLSSPADPGRCRIYHFADDANAATQSLTGSAVAHPRPQFPGDEDVNYTGLTHTGASLQQDSGGLFFFDDLKRGATYLVTIDAEDIDATNGVIRVPTDFTGGAEGIAYLVAGADGKLSVTPIAPA